MKVLIEVIIISLLILIGWRQSFSEHLRRIVNPHKAEEWRIPPPAGADGSRRVPPTGAQATPRDASWMWRRKPLDPPQ
ncbi:MAG TPA: hypothetical protein VFV83_11475 [Chthoniobacteraceae bacterium]|nr:hypothetical protein [Chthoniobacteraceae bacterium]